MIIEIENANKEKLEEIYIHDMYFRGIDLDYKNAILKITVSESNDRYYILIFQKVILFNILKTAPWGFEAQGQILEMYLKDVNIDTLIAEKNNEECKNNINKYKDSFAIEMLLDNGEKLNIICNKVIYIEILNELK